MKRMSISGLSKRTGSGWKSDALRLIWESD
jgi:hypothetical protein